ncbi:uncharacterized protein LOC130946014 [Arachis stenosperma]|uniref:uncharacterized protein LOC130946014 n=1 Tax=Arachis stenosperma TaxID=217475 RepID=UPI0025ABD7BA|nr:uncharacterized protein LOC130946014 [Arachis stenosperma]
MALLEMGANVQCDGYFPGYYSARDLLFESERSPWTSSNVNSELKNELHYVGSLPVSSPCNLLGYNKELLKQTILKHEAIFRDQIHELHRIYNKQKELMEDIKRNESYKQHLRLEASSWSASSLPSKNAQKISYSPNLPWSTAQSLPPGASLQENGKKICPTPVPIVTEESFKDSKPSESKYRKVGKKILDLQLPANEYIDSEEGECLENGSVTDVLQVSAYSLNGSSKVVCGNGEKPYGINSNGFAGLNLQFKLEEATSKSYDLAAPTHNRNNAFYDLSKTTKLSYQNFPNDVIWNLNKRKDPENFSGNPLLEQRKIQEQMCRGQSGGALDSFSKVICTGKQSDSIELLRKNMEQFNDPPYFHPLNHVSEPWPVRKFSSNGSQVQGFMSNGSLGSSNAPRTCSQYDKLSSGISPAELWKTPAYCGQSSIAVPALPFLSSSVSLGQSSKSLMGISVFTQDESYQCKSGKPGHDLDGRHFLLGSRSKPLDLPSISSNDPNSSAKHDSLDSDELRMNIMGSKDVGTLKNLNLNIAPAGYFDITALQSIQIPRKENNLQDSSRGLPWLKEKVVFKGKQSEGSKIATQIDSVFTNSCNVELKKTEESDLSADKILALHCNEGPQMSSDRQPLHVPNQLKSQGADGIEGKCIFDGKLSCIQSLPPAEYTGKNEQKKQESLAGIIDLNSCMIEEENMLMEVDLQAPISPENKECSPPRGESDENQLEMPFQLAGQEDPEAQEEQARVAAEALVTISGFVDNDGLKKTTCLLSESSARSPLHWFAGIASTAADHPENNAGWSSAVNNLDDFSPINMDYFEFMTLNLTETKVLDCCYSNTIGQMEQVGGSTSPTQPRKGRPNRGRWRKDFQSEILSSLASLTRYEVTEDLQIIGGLVAAGTHSETGSLRSAGKNVSARGRRRSGTSISNNTELHLNKITSTTGFGTEKGCLISWGKICRKRRGKRLPTTKPHHILNQVYN